MKFVYWKYKILIVSLFLSLIPLTPLVIHAAQNYTVSIENIHQHFENIVKDFKQTFEHSFGENSTEKLNITAKKLKNSEQTIQKFMQELKKKASELKKTGQSNTELYTFINIILKAVDELQTYFTKVYKVLVSGLGKKLKAAAFAKKLNGVIEPIMTDANFKRIDRYLDQLQRIAQNGYSTIVRDIIEIRTDAKHILEEYKRNKSKRNAAAISMLRKRLPYR